jgi:NAD(P)-dependent dehydrogenase (short-subunit alcohol dehydrogenase family)
MNKPAVLITGALTGIARATAIAFAKDGARLVVSGRRETEGTALEAELRRLGAEASFIQADVRREDEVRELVDQTVARFGRIDAAVNSAGTVIIHGRFSENGRPRNWIVADVVRIADGLLAEHWDVLQDEATRAKSKSGLPMFGDSFEESGQVGARSQSVESVEQ